MAKQKFERTKPHVNIGTIGHVDHGKTTLTAAITLILNTVGGANVKSMMKLIMRRKNVNGVSPSTPPTSNTRPKKALCPRDCQGHADYIKNMITGAAQMDGSITGGIGDRRPNAPDREHILLARQVGVPYGRIS